jgi:electron transport complex protein RnfB
MCPVDCIALITQGLGVKGTEAWCEVDLESCIGCELCVRIPRRRSEPYTLLVCPWEAIEMVPTERAAEVVARIGGPTEYATRHRDRLVAAAERLAALRESAARSENIS